MAFEQKDFVSTHDFPMYTSKVKGDTKLLSIVILNFIGESGDTTKSLASAKSRIGFYFLGRPNMLAKIEGEMRDFFYTSHERVKDFKCI